jgi:excisionase family DNA binding protein
MASRTPPADEATQPDRRWATVTGAAEYLCVSEKTLRRMIDRRELPAYRVGRRLMRVDLAEIDAKLHVLRGYADGGRR